MSELKKYSELSFGDINERSMPLITSRGCPFRCGFCYNTAFNRNRWRAMSSKVSLERLKSIIERFK